MIRDARFDPKRGKKLECNTKCCWCRTQLTWIYECKCPGNPEPHGRCPKCGTLVWVAVDDAKRKDALHTQDEAVPGFHLESDEIPIHHDTKIRKVWHTEEWRKRKAAKGE